jgi:hypothetical protein
MANKKSKRKFYKYPNDDEIFELKKIKGYIYKFKCGHWCTDTVFNELIDIETGLAEWQKPKQLKLF